MTTDMRGLYVHIPFCLKKCNYCDFCSFDNLNERVKGEYLSALLAEIRSYKRSPKITINTVFFGGGTPSLLSAEEFSALAREIQDSFDLSSLAEFTVEANPKTLTLEKLLNFKRHGVNRLSIGLQSIHEHELKKLGRIHNLCDFETSLSLAREAGFDNINVDLMYGIPEQTKASFEKVLDYVMKLNLTHISLYGLIVEENTPFGRMGKNLVLPSEDEEADFYYLAAKKLKENGFSHYEISNYSKPLMESRHNLIYWQREEYIGVGLSAHSLYSGERLSNTDNLSEYLTKDVEQYQVREKISLTDASYEYAMLHLRLKRGFSLKEYKEKFQSDFLLGREDKISRYKSLNLLKLDGDRISLTDEGFYVSNAILSDLL